MSFLNILYTLLIQPLQLFFELIYMAADWIIGDPGLSIIALSLAMNFLVLPLYRKADAMQEEERQTELRLHEGLTHIKKTYKGDERMMILQTFYRQNDYKPTYVLKGPPPFFLRSRSLSRPTVSSPGWNCFTASPLALSPIWVGRTDCWSSQG